MEPGTHEWLHAFVEDVIDPDVAIIDPHHHLWPVGEGLPYALADLEEDLAAGHHIIDTVFVECHSSYRPDGPEHLRPVGETEFVTAASEASSRQVMGGIVAHADLTDAEHLDEVLDAHAEAAHGRLRGIRHAGSHALHPEVLMIPGRAPAGLYADEAFRAGVRRLAERGLTFDTWHYHYQNPEFAEFARAVPDTTIILDHFGTPLGVGPYANQREEIHERWTVDIADIATIPNVFAKLGGLAMPDNGFGWNTAERPPTSDEFVEAQGRYYRHMIDRFGPSRCMFESNFPVDRFSLPYRTLWNALKKIAAPYSPTERDQMFRATAASVYRLGS
jgi:predicted TIM-barrel fold metal-dependent hydrolase